MRTANEANKEKFLKAAVSELEEHGIADFSIRRVAKKCGVSCAAPYKHFESKTDLLAEVMRYIGKKWNDVLTDTVEAHKDEPIRDQLVAICMAYIAFLCTYPEYQTILYMSDRVFQPDVLAEKSKVSITTSELISEYCRLIEIDEETKRRKVFVVRSLLFGGAIMINSGMLPFDGGTMDMIKANIIREFDIA
ncbi:MAG: TetR/AcrR family transcriptional regulator [Clostridia bacterium]|nr:TetR/AcrR family transcriptional regulator [Clostridia bacterium]